MVGAQYRSLPAAPLALWEWAREAEDVATVADLRNTGTAWMAWLDEQRPGAELGVPEAVDLGDFRSVSHGEVFRRLHPQEDFFYMLEVPAADGWGNPIELWVLGPAESPESLLMRSAGCDGELEGQVYDIEGFPSTACDREIVWVNGFFCAGRGRDRERNQGAPFRHEPHVSWVW